MKERVAAKARSKQSSLVTTASEDEIVVSQILLDLENLFVTVKSRSKFVWGCKKRRSCRDEASSFAREPSSKPPLARKIQGRSQVEAEEEVPRAASSPDTPLSFSPSESDEKSKSRSKKSSVRRSIEEYNDLIDGLTERGDSYRREIANVRNHHQKLKAYNSELKAVRQEMLNTCLKKDDPRMEPRFVDIGTDFTRHSRVTMSPPPQQPPVADRTAERPRNSFGPNTDPQLSSSRNVDELVSRVGPFRVPDLNISAEEAFEVDSREPLDATRALADKRARFAEARRMRRGIIKIKSMRKACGVSLPRRTY